MQNSSETPAILMAVLFILHPWAAVGAFGGCCFFLAAPNATQAWSQRFLLGVFSWIMGYASGTFFYPGPPWLQEAMLVSAIVAALSSVAFTSIYAAMQNDTDLPRWLLSTVEIIKSWGRK